MKLIFKERRKSMFSSRDLRKFAFLSAALIGVIGFAEGASAATWAQTHPRRAEVNHRINHQTVRIAKAEAAGKISPAKASKLLRKNAKLRREERTMASLNHGHITRAEKKALNQQENKVGKHIQ
jgi:hypothetical protein